MDAFISYSHADRPFVQRLRDALTERSKTVWVDEQDIPAASRWADDLKAAIEQADAFVFVISPDSAASVECRKELDVRRRQSVPGRGTFGDDFGSSLAHSGSELNAAETWVAGSPGKEPATTALQQAYVLTSRQAATRGQRIPFSGQCLARRGGRLEHRRPRPAQRRRRQRARRPVPPIRGELDGRAGLRSPDRHAARTEGARLRRQRAGAERIACEADAPARVVTRAGAVLQGARGDWIVEREPGDVHVVNGDLFSSLYEQCD